MFTGHGSEKWRASLWEPICAPSNAAEQCATFLAQSGSILASSLDHEASLANIAQLAVPVLADLCVVDIVDDDGSLRRLVTVHTEPAKADFFRRTRQGALGADGSDRLSKILRSGKSELIADLSSFVSSLGSSESMVSTDLLALSKLGMRTAMVVPFVARGQSLGAISLARTARPYAESDLAFVEQIALRTALAIENARLYHRVQEATRTKDEFLATISHELRTPLHTILGWSHMLRAHKLDEETSLRALETIERNARSQAQLLEDLLDVSRIVTGRLRLEFRDVHLAPIIAAAAHSVRPAADAKHIRLQLLLDHRVGPVSGDPIRLRQIVWNLLSNAIKFTTSGGLVQVRLERARKEVTITVTDTGQGIRKCFLPYVFERFRQADAGTTRRHNGLGLGLALVRHLAEIHGGTVHAESPGEGQGATFRVQLPMQNGPAKENGPANENAHAKENGSAGETRTHVSAKRGDEVRPAASDPGRVAAHPRADENGGSGNLQAGILRGLRVLAVDGDPDMLGMIATVLGLCGAEVKVACSARQALSRVAEWRPDVLIADITIRDHEGHTLAHRLATLGNRRGERIHTVALLSRTRVEEELRARALGFETHVMTTIEPDELLSVITCLSSKAAA